jgi:hypothetical protein
MLLPWNDEKEERWFEEKARSGWHLRRVGFFGGYTLERGAPAEVAYRLDFGPSARRDRDEYLGLYRDAGWEHVGARGHLQYFRRAVVDGKVPEIFTDPASRVAKYRRVMAVLGMMLGMLAVVIAPKWPVPGAQDHWRLVDKVYASAFVLKLVVMAYLLYGIVRLNRLIERLKRQHPQSS